MNYIEPSHYSDNRIATEGRKIIRSISGLYQKLKMVCKNFNTESSVQAEELGSVVDMIAKKLSRLQEWEGISR